MATTFTSNYNGEKYEGGYSYEQARARILELKKTGSEPHLVWVGKQFFIREGGANE